MASPKAISIVHLNKAHATETETRLFTTKCPLCSVIPSGSDKAVNDHYPQVVANFIEKCIVENVLDSVEKRICWQLKTTSENLLARYYDYQLPLD